MKRHLLCIVCAALAVTWGLADEHKPWGQGGREVGQEIMGPDGAPMVWVPAGEFMMGSDEISDAEKPVHRVQITKGFWLHKYEVTNGQYADFLKHYGELPFERERNGRLEVIAATLRRVDDTGDVRYMGAVQHGLRFQDGHFAVKEGRGDYPVVWVTWVGARDYARHYGLQLPTEAQWEYAARGPESRRYPWGDGWSVDNCCNVDNWGNGYPPTMAVGSITSGGNWCGAFDMAGNASEWCADWYAEDYYSGSPSSDPTGPEEGTQRVLRGGSWFSTADTCRSAVRDADPKTHSYYDTGFRCVIVPE